MEREFEEFRKKTLAEAGMSSSDEEDEEDDQEVDKTHPALVMIDEQTGNKYMRIVDQKGLGEGMEMKWLIRALHEELKAWGRPSGGDKKPS